jgi:hypothetical protein
MVNGKARSSLRTRMVLFRERPQAVNLGAYFVSRPSDAGVCARLRERVAFLLRALDQEGQ